MPTRRPPDPYKKLPEAFKACRDGWEVKSNDETPFEVLTEKEFSEKFLTSSLVETYCHYADSMDRHLALNGLEANDVNTMLILLPNTVIEKLVVYCNQRLTQHGLLITNNKEYRIFLHTSKMAS